MTDVVEIQPFNVTAIAPMSDLMGLGFRLEAGTSTRFMPGKIHIHPHDLHALRIHPQFVQYFGGGWGRHRLEEDGSVPLDGFNELAIVYNLGEFIPDESVPVGSIKWVDRRTEAP